MDVLDFLEIDSFQRKETSKLLLLVSQRQTCPLNLPKLATGVFVSSEDKARSKTIQSGELI